MKMKFVKSYHMVIALAVLMVIITGLSLLQFNKSTEKEMLENFNDEQLHIVQDLSGGLKTYLKNRVQLVVVLSSLSSFQNLDTKYIEREIDQFIAYEKNNYVRKLSLYDEKGTIIYSSNKEIVGHHLGESDVFQWAKKPENKGKQFISAPIKSFHTQADTVSHLHFVIAVPIYKTSGKTDKKNFSEKFVGVITETLDFDKLLYDVISTTHQKRTKEHLWILDKAGILLFHADHPEMAYMNVKKQTEKCLRCHVSFDHINTIYAKGEGTVEYQLKNKPPKLASFTTLKYDNISWSVVLNTPSEEVAGFIKKNLMQSYLLLSAITFTFFMISFLIYRSYKLRVKAETEYEQLREKSELKEKIVESETRYRNLVESAPDAIVVHCEGKLVYVNNACATLLGATEQKELIGKPVLNFVHEDYREIVKKRMKEVPLKNMPSTLIEEKFVKIDGTSVDVEVIAIPTKYNSKPAVQVVARDITERRIAENELRKSETKYRDLTEDALVGIYTTSLSGAIVYANEALCKMLEYCSREELMNVGIIKCYKNQEDRRRLIDQLKEANHVINYEVDMVTKTGKVKNFILSAALQGDYLSGTIMDLTENKLAQIELIKEKEKAELANKLKDAFINNMSHEIRTPLNGILGLTTVIKESYAQYITEEDESLFTGINTSSRRIIRTVDMILNYSRLHAGEFPFIPTELDLCWICENVIEEYRDDALKNDIELLFENRCERSKIIGNEYSITQVVANLIDNAIKYTQKGFAKVTLSPNENGRILLEINDSGIGIGEEYLEHLFEAYQQEDIGYGRAYEGLGLGLALTKKYCELNKANITITSKKREGTTVSVTFLEAMKTTKENALPEKIIGKFESKDLEQNRTVMIVEDDFVNQLTIKRFLENKYRTLWAVSADEAMDVLKMNKVDVILMDISINGSKDGLELTKELKALKEYSNIPIIAVTAHAFEKDRQNAIAKGCDEYLSKPFTKVQLLEKIEKFKKM